MTLSNKELAQRQQASRRHGVYAFQSRGEDALTEPQKALFGELQEKLQTPEGLAAAKVELAATALFMVELAQAHLRERAKAGEPVFGDPVEGRFSTWVAEARRQLEALPESAARKSLNEVLNG